MYSEKLLLRIGMRYEFNMMLLGAFTGQSATVFLLVGWRGFSKDFLQVITGLSYAFDEAL